MFTTMAYSRNTSAGPVVYSTNHIVWPAFWTGDPDPMSIFMADSPVFASSACTYWRIKASRSWLRWEKSFETGTYIVPVRESAMSIDGDDGAAIRWTTRRRRWIGPVLPP